MRPRRYQRNVEIDDVFFFWRSYFLVQRTLQRNPVTRQVGSSYKGATVYGWVLMLTGLFLLFSGLANLLISQNVTPPSTRFGNSRPISIIFSIAQGLLFVATGIAIIRKKRIAVTLVWTGTGLSGLGLFLNSLIPLDLFLWLLSLGLAIWYSKKTPLLT